jgi:hypothetical protein
MALAERAELVARLSLKDDFSRKAGTVSKNFSASMAKIQKTAIQGARNTATNLGRIGVVAGGFIALNVKSGISSLAELEDAVTSVDGAIGQVGKGWSTTGQTIARWANEIETSVQRAFDDKEITQAATTLIRYGKISEQQLRPAMEVMTDLAAKTGDVGTAGELLARSLAAPEKAAGRLVRQGIILDETTQKNIASLVKAGKVGEAQALVLEAIARQTKGAAAAMNGPYRDALETLKDVTEDAQRALGEAFLPVISKVADKLSNELAKPETIENLRNFGKTLAGAFDKVLEAGQKIPWGTIGDSLKLAGTGAKAVFDAFTMLPPWVQTAVLTGWGLNKLSGGALGTIVGELGKGLIKGVLGINAGVVNVRGAVVNGGGGVVPGGGKGGGALAFLGMAGLAAAIGGLVGTVISDVWTQLDPNITVHRDENGKPVTQNRATHERKPVGAQPFDGKVGRTLRVYGQVEDRKGAIKWEQISRNTAATKERTSKVTTALRDHKAAVLGKLERDIDATRTAGARSKAATERMRGALSQKMANVAAAERSGTARITAAIRANRPIIRVNVSMPTIRVSSGGTTAQRWFNGKQVPI